MVDEMAARPEPRPTADGRFMGDIAATLATEPFFADVTRLLGLGHVESFFDDWARQPLLARRLSRLGPGVSWYDVNGDGWDDLLVTAGRGGKLTVCLNEQGKGFRKLEGAEETSGDQTTVLGCADGRGGRHLLVGVSNYELGGPALSLIRTLTATNLAVTTTQPGAAGLASLGPMALGDVDGDGDLDLFVGGRCLPGRYPEASSSSLWLNDGGRLTRAEQWSRPFQGLGLVSGATFVDLDGDGDPDLALALDWGPVRIYRNDAGGFADITASSGLDRLTGWWTSVVAGDFNGDGRPDLVCGNWGRNSIYELYQPTSLRVYYGDWDDDGVVELIEAWQSDGRWLPIRDRAWLARGLPDLPTRFPTHRAFAEATIEQILPPGRANVPYLEATQLASTLFLNRGGRFEPVPLPLEAQTAPVFAINVADFDGDGFEDLFLGQNWFGSSSDLSRDDSGLGLWLRGTGQGGFEAVRSSRSGIRVLGEQRGAGVADFDHDGRVDLAVSQNGAEVRLYRNQGGKPGIRVTLRGPAANPDGVGALMRLRYDGDRWGPGRIVQAGSGYWSQDAASQVLGLAGAPMAVWIRWPGGREQTVPLTASNREVQVECPP